MGNIKEDIIRMIDGELSADESSRVMEEINQSPELESFYKAAKQSTSALQSYFGSEEVKEAVVRLEKFVDSAVKDNLDAKVPDNKNASWFGSLFDQFTLKPVYAMAAVVVLFVIVNNVYNFEMNYYLYSDNIEEVGFSKSNKEITIWQYRSALSNSIESEIAKALDELIKAKITSATLTLQTDLPSKSLSLKEGKLRSLSVSINILKYGSGCYYGEIDGGTDGARKFSYCLYASSDMDILGYALEIR